MKFLIDNNLSPSLVKLFNSVNIDAVHVKQHNMQTISDEDIFEFAYKSDRTIITADTDFGYILSKWEKNLPSVIIFRAFSSLPEKQFDAIKHLIEFYSEEIISGNLFIVMPHKIRIKKIPFL